MKALVTGGAGFIGSNLVDKLIFWGYEVAVLDNLSNGKLENINEKADFIKGDIKDFDFCKNNIKDVDVVFHLAADVDVRRGVNEPNLDFKENIVGTHNILESMRLNGVNKIVFTSSSVIYGEASIMPTPENYGPLVPISLYAASKLSDEAMISAYCHTFDIQSWIYRFANVIGPRDSHGILFDFIHKLNKDPNNLEILGDGSQSKSYVFVHDCCDAMLVGFDKGNDKVNIFNIGSDDFVDVVKIADLVCNEMKLTPNYNFTGGDRGWVGDIRHMQLDTSRLKSFGWSANHNSESAIVETVKSLLKK